MSFSVSANAHSNKIVAAATVPTRVFYSSQDLVASFSLQGCFSPVSNKHVLHLPTRIVGSQDFAIRISIQDFSTQVLRTQADISIQMTLPVILRHARWQQPKSAQHGAEGAPCFQIRPQFCWRQAHVAPLFAETKLH